MTKILIIEDSQDIRENTAELLELSGYSVDTAKPMTMYMKIRPMGNQIIRKEA
jgi:CheY-like chemotaxis protein